MSGDASVSSDSGLEKREARRSTKTKITWNATLKYFTKAWANGELPDTEADAVVRNYRDHILSLTPTLPSAIVKLALEVDLHDAVIRRVLVDRKSQNLRMELLAGDKIEGYFDADLDYSGVRFENTQLQVLASVARDRRSELLYDELDRVDDNGYVHRFLFWPEHEFEIIFGGLSLRRDDRESRSVPFVGDPYQEIEIVESD